MPTFIDESGDTSAHPDSRPYYRLAAVWVPPEGTDPLRASLAGVRAALGRSPGYEFKFHATHLYPERRTAFYEAVMAHGVRFAVACIDKRGWRRADRLDYFYATAMYLATSLRPVYHDAELAGGKLLREPVVVDRNDDGAFLEVVRHAFRGLHSVVRPGLSLCQNPRFADSQVAELLQVADMVCGAAGAMLDGEPRFYQQIAAAGEMGCWG